MFQQIVLVSLVLSFNTFYLYQCDEFNVVGGTAVAFKIIEEDFNSHTPDHCNIPYKEKRNSSLPSYPGTVIPPGIFLNNCTLIGADKLELVAVDSNKLGHRLEGSRALVNFSNVTIVCRTLTVYMLRIYEISAQVLNISAHLTGIENNDNAKYSLVYQQLSDPEPKIGYYRKGSYIDFKYFKPELFRFYSSEIRNYLTKHVSCKVNYIAFKVRIVMLGLSRIEPILSIPDKQITRKENLGILTITTEIYLRDCFLTISNIKVNGIDDEAHVQDFKIIKSRITFSNVTASCKLTILKAGIHWKSRITVMAVDTPAELITVNNSVLNQTSVKYRLIREPEITLSVDDQPVFMVVVKHHLLELSTYLSGLISGYFQKKALPETLDRLT